MSRRYQQSRSFFFVIAALSALVASGCQPSGPVTYPVSGTVTWKGEPLVDGDILFTSTTGDGVPDPGVVVNGRFAFRAKPGPQKVEILATREEGAPDSVMNAPRRVQYLPARYNDATELKAEVTPDGPNKFQFDLTEK